jgi:protein-L-isoaspartate O-methyltransferase
MAEELHATVGCDDTWRTLFATVPRENFVPGTYHVWDTDTQAYRDVSRDSEPDMWARPLYDADQPIITRFDREGPSSSSSAPRVMARMLRLLSDANVGRVLEIGTGTGYNAALLAARFGGARVVTVESDPRIAESARKALANVGVTPRVVIGDGALGFPEAAPYDAIIATCAVTEIPPAWIEQAPAGLIIAPFARPWSRSACAVLRVEGERASGHFLDGFDFMSMRGRDVERRAPDTGERDGVRDAVTVLRPDWVHASSAREAAFALGLALPDCSCEARLDRDADTYVVTVYDAAGSWATVEWVGDADEYAVRQFGPRSLWDEVAAAYRWWAAAGYPCPDRFGITATTSGTSTFWFDVPSQPLDAVIAAHRRGS